VQKKLSLILFLLNNLGSEAWRNLLGRQADGELTDITKDGDLSCAFFAGNAMRTFGLIENSRATVASTLWEMKRERTDNSGHFIAPWYQVSRPKPGDVLEWGIAPDGRGDEHSHIGFYVGWGLEVSTNPVSGRVDIRSWDRQGKKVPIAIYRSPILARERGNDSYIAALVEGYRNYKGPLVRPSYGPPTVSG
jgi:hypothetical protein